MVIVLHHDILMHMISSQGSGKVIRSAFSYCAHSVVLEAGVLVFHPENIEIHENVYVGHYAILKAYYKNRMRIGEGSWIGQGAFLHSAGGITIGKRVGIGPGVKIITSQHEALGVSQKAVMDGTLKYAEVILEDGCDIGVGAIILPGVRIGVCAQVGAGAVVIHDVPDGETVVGVPAKVVHKKT